MATPEIFIGCGELDAVAGSELALCLAKDIYASESSRVIGDARSIFQLDSQSVGASIHRTDGGEAATLYAFSFAAGSVLQHLSGVIPGRPGSVYSGHVRAVGERAELLAVVGQRTVLQQLGAYGFVYLLAALIVGGNDDRVFWPCCIVFGDRFDTILTVGNLRHSALLCKQCNSLLSLVAREMLHGF